MYYKKITHREELAPVFRVLTERARRQRLKDVAQVAGLTDWQTGRLLASAISSPSFMDMARLLKALGMTPNDAADLAGVGTSASAYERRAQLAMRDPRLNDTQRELLCRDLEAIANMFADANARMAATAGPDTASERLVAVG